MPLSEYMDVNDKLHKAVVDLLYQLVNAIIEIDEEDEELMPDEDKEEAVFATMALASADIIEEVHKHD